jgi:hypothetical protein
LDLRHENDTGLQEDPGTSDDEGVGAAARICALIQRTGDFSGVSYEYIVSRVPIKVRELKVLMMLTP